MPNDDERCAVMNVNSYFVAGSRPETLNRDWAVNTSVRSVTWEQRLSFTQPSLCKHCRNNRVNHDLHQCEYRILWEEHKKKFCRRSRFAPCQNVCGDVKQWQLMWFPLYTTQLYRYLKNLNPCYIWQKSSLLSYFTLFFISILPKTDVNLNLSLRTYLFIVLLSIVSL